MFLTANGPSQSQGESLACSAYRVLQVGERPLDLAQHKGPPIDIDHLPLREAMKT